MQASPRTFGGPQSRNQQINANLNTGNATRQMVSTKAIPSKIVIEDLVSTQSTLKREILRSDETVQAIRQENIMLVEKVQHATNLYRQLLGRVAKTEERMMVEHKSVTTVIAQAKAAEQQMVHQQEQLNSKESHLAIQIQRLQEEMLILKADKESSRKQFNTMNQDIRQLQDRVIRQTSTLSTGLQELKMHLDQKEKERAQSAAETMNEIVTKLDAVTHQQSMFQTQAEGRTESLRLQINQSEKQRQNDLYQINTVIREKEALTKADTRRLQEKVKELFEEFNKQIGQREMKSKQDMDARLIGLEKKISSESKQSQRQLIEHEEEINQSVNEFRENMSDEIESMKSKVEENESHGQLVGKILDDIKEHELSITQNKKDIEKVVRAEITSRLSQGEKFTHQLNQLHKDNSEGLTLMQDIIGDAKRKHEQTIETNKKDMVRMINEGLKDSNSDKRVESFEKKMEDIEDALDELAKLEDRIEMNSERIKQMEMENILAQGDMHANIDGNTKHMQKYEYALQQMASNVNASNEEIQGLETKLRRVAEKLESVEPDQPSNNLYLSNGEMIKPSPPPPRKGTPLPRAKRPTKFAKIHKMELELLAIQETADALKEVLSTIVNERYKKNTNDSTAKELKEKLDELDEIDGDDDTSSDENEEKKDLEKPDYLLVAHKQKKTLFESSEDDDSTIINGKNNVKNNGKQRQHKSVKNLLVETDDSDDEDESIDDNDDNATSYDDDTEDDESDESESDKKNLTKKNATKRNKRPTKVKPLKF